MDSRSFHSHSDLRNIFISQLGFLRRNTHDSISKVNYQREVDISKPALFKKKKERKKKKHQKTCW